MRGFSAESISKLQILNFILPVICQRLAMMKKRLMIIDTYAGPGHYDDPDLGAYPGSPEVVHNTASMLDVESRLVLIEKDRETYVQLLQFIMQLKSTPNVAVVPIMGDCQDHIERLVKLAADAPTLLIADPCGSQIPASLPKVASQQNVTLLLRYSLSAALRRDNCQCLQDALTAFNMPYWGFNSGDVKGLHKYGLLLGAHDQQIVTSCQGAMSTVESASAALVQHSEQFFSTVPANKRSASIARPKRGYRYIQLPPHTLERMRQLRQRGLSLVKIAETLDIGPNVVASRLKELARMPSTKKRGGRRTVIPAHKLKTMKKLRKTGMSLAQIAKTVNLHASTVERRLKGTTPAKSAQSGSGHSAERMQLSPSTLARMVKLRRNAVSVSKIAETLGLGRNLVWRRLRDYEKQNGKKFKAACRPGPSDSQVAQMAKLRQNGLSFREVAEVTGLAVSTIAGRLKRKGNGASVDSSTPREKKPSHNRKYIRFSSRKIAKMQKLRDGGAAYEKIAKAMNIAVTTVSRRFQEGVLRN